MPTYIQSKKRLFCQNYTLLLSWVKKVNKMSFFSDFSRKISARMPMYCRKNVHSLKITMLSFPYFVKKTFILSKTRCSPVLFFDIIMKNPMLSCPYFVKKRQICQKYIYYGPKKPMGKNKHHSGHYDTGGGWGENWWINLR